MATFKNDIYIDAHGIYVNKTTLIDSIMEIEFNILLLQC